MDQLSSISHGFAAETRDLAFAASLLHDSAIPYSAELLPGSPAFSTNIFITGSHRVSIARVITTGHLLVKSRLPADAYALVIDLGSTGLGTHHIAKQDISVHSHFAFLQSPLQPVQVNTTPSYKALFLRISRDAVMTELQKMLGRETHTDLVFSHIFRLDTTAGQHLRSLCSELRGALYSVDPQSLHTSLSIRKLESEIITLLLQAQSHNYTRLLNRQDAAGHYQLDAAEQYMRANAHLPLSLGDVCQAAGINARSLQHSFRRKRGCTPMEFLRTIRMEEVRTGLLQPTEKTSVSGEAARWGFLHFGRFSGEYRRAYGELPSETLRRAKTRQ